VQFARFFIDRPIFAAVLSIIIVVAGAISIPILPISEYPDVVPPSVQVRAVYPGANPNVIAETVATPLEEAINGVERMMYMKSVAGSDGVLVLTATFEPGTDPDAAQVQVQNRVSQSLARLPEDVRRLGVTTQKQSSNLTMVVHLRSPTGEYDTLYMRNYVTSKIKDEIARLPGVGQAFEFGGGEYAMRIWIDPDKAARRGLTAGDIVNAIREQNVQVSAGQLGGLPRKQVADVVLSINVKGRLTTEAEFGDIVVKTGVDGEIVRLSDVAHIELGAQEYSLRSLLNNQQAVAVGVFQAPGSNAIDVSNAVRAKMVELSKAFPKGIEYSIAYDPTVFVRDSISEVVRTLFEAVLLVVLVVILFLQTWRASIIPLLAVPVSIVGTFSVLLLLGFSINTLTLFGLVLAIGIVVDDAIVVVENVERHIEEGATPKEAAHHAMNEVSGPIVAIASVLCAVFVPMAFLTGVSGQFFKQFAVTIAISTVISAINSLTLSPALAAVLLKPQGAKPDLLQRGLNGGLGWLFRPFNRGFQRSSKGYERVVSRSLKRRGFVFPVYVALLVGAGFMFTVVPGGFIPTQDKLYLLGVAKLPEGASLDRTEEVVRKLSKIALSTKGVKDAVEFPGLNALQFTNTSNLATIFFGLESFETRKRPAAEIAGELNMKFSQVSEAFGFAIMPPAVLGIGTGSGYSLFIQDRAGRGYGELNGAMNALAGAISQVPGLGHPISSYQANVPQLVADIDRTKAKAQAMALSDVYETLQTYLGSAYVNDFNRFGRTYQVIAQADEAHRNKIEDLTNLRTRNLLGEMVPIGSVATVKQSYGPDPVMRYNGYPAADLIGEADKTVMSSNQAMALITAMAPKVLPNGFQFEWSDLSYQQIHEGSRNALAFPLAILLAFLVLAALYESWTLPLAVILIVPMCVLSALIGVWATGGDNNIFVQVGLVVLMGLACKNAILIVEFARELEEQRGFGIVEAALESCRLRLRPIVMTSVAFIAGVVPLMTAGGAGSEVRRAMGITVFAGMLGVTFFGLLLTPVFYVTLRKLAKRSAPEPAVQGAPPIDGAVSAPAED
jgi:multidrug efflux pump